MHSSKASNTQENDTSVSESLDFSSLIAVAIHDMKNSLSLLMQSIELLETQIPNDNTDAKEGINNVHYEANRMNTTLVQLLSLYRCGIDALPVNIDECFLIDLIEEVVESNRAYINQKKLEVSINVNPDVHWYLDRELIYLLVNDVIINAIRYGCNQIQISAQEVNSELHLQVIDDGPGYPQNMLEMASVKLNNFCLSEGRTGLGLFFARLIAQTHKNNGRTGSITLSNDAHTGGSIFDLRLP